MKTVRGAAEKIFKVAEQVKYHSSIHGKVGNNRAEKPQKKYIYLTAT